MALHLLKQGQYAPSWGKVLGSALGEGLSAVAQNKLTRMKENEDIKLFTTLGIDPIRARLIHRLPSGQKEEAIASILRDNEEEKANRAQYDSQGASPVSEALGGQEPQQAQERPGLSNLFSQQKQPLNSPVAPMLLPKELREALEQDQQEAFPQGRQEQAAQQNLQQQPEEQPRPEYKPLRSENEILARALSKGTTTKSQETAKQSSIDRQNAPFNKGLTNATQNAEKALDILNNMEQLLETGKVSSGLYGKVPSILQNSESQQFEANADALAQQLAGQSGVASGFKIRFAQNLKPKLTDREETQKDRIKFLKKEAEKVLSKAQLRDELIEENGGFQPPNLESLMNKRAKELEKSGKPRDTFKAKPNPALYKDKTIINEETGEEEISDGKEWKKV